MEIVCLFFVHIALWCAGGNISAALLRTGKELSQSSQNRDTTVVAFRVLMLIRNARETQTEFIFLEIFFLIFTWDSF